MNNPTPSLICIQWNCFKLTGTRRCELINLISDVKPHVVSLNEIKLSEPECNYFLSLPGYSSFYKTRSKNPQHGGGVALLIKNELNPAQVNIFDIFQNDEIIGAACTLNDVRVSTFRFLLYPSAF